MSELLKEEKDRSLECLEVTVLDEKAKELGQEEDEELKAAKERALLDCFSRVYHFKHFSVRVFNDYFAPKLMNEEEYQETAKKIKGYIEQFQPDFKGNEEEALEWMMEHKVAAAFFREKSFL